RQSWFIRGALTTLGLQDSPRWTSYALPLNAAPVGPEQILEAACAVGDRLCDLALEGESDASWIGLTIFRGKQWILAPLWSDLYGGLPGVILFLAYLGAESGQEKYTILAEKGLFTLRRWFAESGHL